MGKTRFLTAQVCQLQKRCVRQEQAQAPTVKSRTHLPLCVSLFSCVLDQPATGILPWSKGIQPPCTRDTRGAELKRQNARWPGKDVVPLPVVLSDSSLKYQQQHVKPTKVKRKLRTTSKNYLLEPVSSSEFNV